MITYKTKNLMMSSDQLDFDVCTNDRILCGSHHFAFWFSPNQSHNFQAIITNKIGLRKQKKKNSTTKLSWKLLLWTAFYYLNIFFFFKKKSKSTKKQLEKKTEIIVTIKFNGSESTVWWHCSKVNIKFMSTNMQWICSRVATQDRMIAVQINHK